MSSENILKSFVPDDSELNMINQLTRRAVTSDEVFTFSVILCDNEIDRDNERFSIESLHQLKELFIGKTGIFDHNPKGENQTARVYCAQVVCDSSKKTIAGETYTYLKAKAYMMKTEANKSLILEIDGGIKKEVSISCSVREVKCSVCNTNVKLSSCEHYKGRSYGKIPCYHLLSDVTDAYEWSFVAVPAQRNAGITKSLNKQGHSQYNKVKKEVSDNPMNIIKAIEECDDNALISITKSEADELNCYIKQLKQQAELGEQYRKDLISDVYRLSFLAHNNIPADVVKSVLEKMSITELKAYKSAYEQKNATECAIQLLPSNASNINDKSSTSKFKL